jgi:hypothetical protein
VPTPSTRPWISHRSALIGAALAGTLAATYPLLIGRSLVTPANGPTALLYDQPPFVYGYGGGAIEDTRGTDVGAMMWGVLPYTVIQREALRQGEWPLWNRYNGNGQPLWGQGQTFFLDPVHLLSLLIPDPAWAMDLRFIAGRATFALGAGAAVWMATGNVTASALVAFAAPFVGHFSIRFNHPAYFSIVYAPWVLAALAAALRADGRRSKARAGPRYWLVPPTCRSSAPLPKRVSSLSPRCTWSDLRRWSSRPAGGQTRWGGWTR